MQVCFDRFVFDSQSRELRRGERRVHLSPKAFQLLELLLRRRPEALSKSELQAQIWPNTHVTEASLTAVVAELRQALSDNRRAPRFLRTIHGFGYAFCGRASERDDDRQSVASSGLVYRLVSKHREIQLAEGENVLGRDRDTVAWLDSATVSRRHARIIVSDGQATLEDLGSRNGTFLQGRRLDRATPLADGDEVRLGSVLMTFRVFSAAETETERQ